MSASIVHSITKGCNTGNLTDCGCDSKPGMQRYQADSVREFEKGIFFLIFKKLSAFF